MYVQLKTDIDNGSHEIFGLARTFHEKFGLTRFSQQSKWLLGLEIWTNERVGKNILRVFEFEKGFNVPINILIKNVEKWVADR